MKTIQKLFERLAGVTEGELERIGLAAEIFGAEPSLDIALLEKPACWRRSRRCLSAHPALPGEAPARPAKVPRGKAAENLH